jgi:hypothetical protein
MTSRRYNPATMNGNETTVLYRSVGQTELDLIEKSGFKAFPLYLEGQPIFSFLLNEEYARFIASECNANEAFSGYTGYVLRLAVRTDFVAPFEIRKEASAIALEYGIPADRVVQFNENIVGMIELVARYVNRSH